MGVASHLGIQLTEYDRRIRTFIPDYEEMLDAAAKDKGVEFKSFQPGTAKESDSKVISSS